MLLLRHTGTNNVSTTQLLYLKFRIMVEKRQKDCRGERKFSVRLLLEMSIKKYTHNVSSTLLPKQNLNKDIQIDMVSWQGEIP